MEFAVSSFEEGNEKISREITSRLFHHEEEWKNEQLHNVDTQVAGQ